MKRAWLAGVGLMMTMAFVACSGDDEFDGGGNNNNNADSGVSSSSGQQASSSGQNGSSSGETSSSSGQTSSSSGENGSSSGEASSSSGENGSSSGEASSSSGENGSSSGGSSSGGSSSGGEPPADPFLAACTSLADLLAPLACGDLADRQAYIDTCYAERLVHDGGCEALLLADKQCLITLPEDEFECVADETLIKLSNRTCADVGGEALGCLFYGPE